MDLSNPKLKSGSLDDFFKQFANWLGYDGMAFVLMLREEYGSKWETACWNEGGIPHPVHFREGMQLRNYMRGWKVFEEMGWDAHDFDNNYAYYTEIAIETCLKARV